MTTDLGLDTFSRRVLLTGAGFSKNWGGFLATEVWNVVYTKVSSRPALKELLLRERSFEECLGAVRGGGFGAEDAAALEAAIVTVFDQMDRQFRQPNAPVAISTVNDLISRFCPGGVGVGTGYMFTLNQDMLPERIYGVRPERQKLVLSGVKWTSPPMMLFPAGSSDIPTATIFDPSATSLNLRGNFNLLKLHGSSNWRTAGGAASMVVGTGKPALIAATPLLAWFYELFERVLCIGNVRLMVIGYGWLDEHVNAVIAKAVRDHGLKVFLWAPSHPADALSGKSHGPEILQGLMGAASLPLNEVMPAPMNPITPEYQRIVGAFF